MVRQSSKDVEKVFKIKKIQDPTTVLWLEIVVERIRTCLGWVRQLDVRVFWEKNPMIGRFEVRLCRSRIVNKYSNIGIIR